MREVPEQPTRLRVVLLGEEGDVVAERLEPLEQLLCLSVAARAGRGCRRARSSSSRRRARCESGGASGGAKPKSRGRRSPQRPGTRGACCRNRIPNEGFKIDRGPVLRLEVPVQSSGSQPGLHPRVGNQDPTDRKGRPQADHAGRGHHGPVADPALAEDEQPQKAGLERRKRSALPWR